MPADRSGASPIRGVTTPFVNARQVFIRTKYGKFLCRLQSAQGLVLIDHAGLRARIFRIHLECVESRGGLNSQLKWTVLRSTAMF